MSEELHLVDARERQVRKANAIIQKSRFSLSTQQQKVVLYLISKIDARDTDFKEYDLDIQEFCRVCGIDYTSGKNYKDLKAAIQGIADKSMWIELESGEDSLIRWIEKARVSKKSGKIKIRLDNDLKPYLLELKRNYTSYQLIFTLHFNSKYSIRLYELITSLIYHDEKPYKVEFTIEELKLRLGAENYKEYKNFKARVLEQAVAEINEFSDKTLSYEEITRGRKVVGIELVISAKDTIERLKVLDRIDKDLGTNQLALY